MSFVPLAFPPLRPFNLTKFKHNLTLLHYLCSIKRLRMLTTFHREMQFNLRFYLLNMVTHIFLLPTAQFPCFCFSLQSLSISFPYSYFEDSQKVYLLSLSASLSRGTSNSLERINNRMRLRRWAILFPIVRLYHTHSFYLCLFLALRSFSSYTLFVFA